MKRRRSRKTHTRSYDPSSDARLRSAALDLRRDFLGTPIKVETRPCARRFDGSTIEIVFDGHAVDVPEGGITRPQEQREWFEAIVAERFSALPRDGINRELEPAGITAGRVQEGVGIELMNASGKRVGVIAARHAAMRPGGWIRGDFLLPGQHWQAVLCSQSADPPRATGLEGAAELVAFPYRIDLR